MVHDTVSPMMTIQGHDSFADMNSMLSPVLPSTTFSRPQQHAAYKATIPFRHYTPASSAGALVSWQHQHLVQEQFQVLENALFEDEFAVRSLDSDEGNIVTPMELMRCQQPTQTQVNALPAQQLFPDSRELTEAFAVQFNTYDRMMQDVDTTEVGHASTTVNNRFSDCRTDRVCSGTIGMAEIQAPTAQRGIRSRSGRRTSTPRARTIFERSKALRPRLGSSPDPDLKFEEKLTESGGLRFVCKLLNLGGKTCNERFKRMEHLKRHSGSKLHVGVKPKPVAYCFAPTCVNNAGGRKEFTRRDNAIDHAVSHFRIDRKEKGATQKRTPAVEPDILFAATRRGNPDGADEFIQKVVRRVQYARYKPDNIIEWLQRNGHKIYVEPPPKKIRGLTDEEFFERWQRAQARKKPPRAKL